jgi:hypothetical protein
MSQRKNATTFMRSAQGLFLGLQRPTNPTLYPDLVKRDESRKFFAGLACHKS